LLFAAGEYILAAKVTNSSETIGTLGLIVSVPNTYIVQSIGAEVKLTGMDLGVEVRACDEQYVIPVANSMYAIHQSRIVAIGIGKDEEF
jgi:hypothetical protein